MSNEFQAERETLADVVKGMWKHYQFTTCRHCHDAGSERWCSLLNGELSACTVGNYALKLKSFGIDVIDEAIIVKGGVRC